MTNGQETDKRMNAAKSGDFALRKDSDTRQSSEFYKENPCWQILAMAFYW